MKNRAIFFLCFYIMIICSLVVQAQENSLDEVIEDQKKTIIDYNNIQDEINQLNIKDKNKNVSFKQLINDLITGKHDYSVMSTINYSIKLVFQEVFLNMDLMAQIIMITIVIAIFSNFTSAFSNKYISEVAFFVTFIILSAILMKTFQMVSTLSSDTIDKSVKFMQALVPSFFASISISGNFNSVFIFHETVLFIIYVINWIILEYIIPVINLIVVLEIANNITEENLLSKLIELCKSGVSWILKSILIFFFGLNILQGLSIPMIDTITHKSVKNAMQVVPVIGASLEGVTDTILGATILIKNAVGIGGIIVLLTICLIPILKIVAFILIYKVSAALIQPISNNRVIECLSGVGDAVKLLLSSVVTVVLLFLISIAIIAISTNVAYIGG